MRSPMTLCRRWWKGRGNRLQIRCIERRLSDWSEKRLRLRNLSGSDGTVFQVCWPEPDSRIAGCVRIADLERPRSVDEPHLPRILLAGRERLQHEARCYSRLSATGVCPQLLKLDEQFLMNEWLPWPRVSEILRRREASVWDVLPLAISGLQKMHACGIVHLDLNCGNMLLHPHRRRLALIDFEYKPRPDISFETLCAFDYIRLVHNVLRRRRGLKAIGRDPERFVRLFSSQLTDSLSLRPAESAPLLSGLHASCFYRLESNPMIRKGIEQLFGPIPRIC